MTSVFAPGSSPTGPVLTAELEATATRRLGYELPIDLLTILRIHNGGVLNRQCLETPFSTSWSPDHISIDGLLPLGGEEGMDGQLGSQYMIDEWGYPAIGVVFGTTPAGGHDAVMLDYRAAGEPSIVYADEDRSPRTIATSFADLLERLVDCNHFAA